MNCTFHTTWQVWKLQNLETHDNAKSLLIKSIKKLFSSKIQVKGKWVFDCIITNSSNWNCCRRCTSRLHWTGCAWYGAWIWSGWTRESTVTTRSTGMTEQRGYTYRWVTRFSRYSNPIHILKLPNANLKLYDVV
jgi:hypothetical protein